MAGFIWYELMSTDPKASEAFYGSVVGWTGRVFAGGQDYTVLGLGGRETGGIMATPPGMGSFWIGYVAVDDVDAACRAIAAAGGKVEKEAWDIPGVGRLAAVSDPQGAGYMLMAPQGPAPADTPPMGTPGQAGWHELHTSDWEKAFAFYSGLYGWAKGEAMDMGAMGTYQIITDGGQQFGAMFNSTQAPRPAWLFYFNVDSIDRAVAAVNAGGGQVINGPMQVPGGGWIINGIDPQGAMFALVGAR